MTQHQWNDVDDYIAGLLIGQDEALDNALAASDRAGLPQINVSPNHGKLLNLIARMHGAAEDPRDRHARRLQHDLARPRAARGRQADHAGVRPAPRRGGHGEHRGGRLADRVEVWVGPALDTLPALSREGPFDLFFIDADKANNPNYVRWALDHSRPGSVIIVDNVVRSGLVVDANSTDPSVVGTRELGTMLAKEPRVDATMVQTVGSKGYDGFALALVIG